MLVYSFDRSGSFCTVPHSDASRSQKLSDCRLADPGKAGATRLTRMRSSEPRSAASGRGKRDLWRRAPASRCEAVRRAYQVLQPTVYCCHLPWRYSLSFQIPGSPLEKGTRARNEPPLHRASIRPPRRDNAASATLSAGANSCPSPVRGSGAAVL